MKEITKVWLVTPEEFDRNVIINEFEEGDLIAVVRAYRSIRKISSIEFYFRTNSGYKKLNKEVKFNYCLSTFNVKFLKNIFEIYFLLSVLILLLGIHLLI